MYRTYLAMVTAIFFLATAVLVNLVLGYQYMEAREQYKLSRDRARQAAASVSAGYGNIQRYLELRQQAEQFMADGIAGISVATGVRAMQQLAAQTRDSSYSFSLLPDSSTDGVSSRQAGFEFHTILPAINSFPAFMASLKTLKAGVFTPQQCRLRTTQKYISLDCKLKWTALRSPLTKLMEGS